MKPIKGGDIILNPIMAQMQQMEQQSKMEAQQQQQEADDQERVNTNPFLDEEDENPFAKSFNNWFNKELVA